MLIARDYFPLGTGLASFGSHASRIYYSSVYFEYGLSNVWGLSPQFSGFITDTFWPMVVGEGGVVSLISYVCFLGVLIRVAWQTAKDRLVTPELRFFGLFVLFVLVGSLLESTSSHIYDATMQSSFVMIPAGALLIRRSKSAS
jgi:O-antigen ligase